MQTLVELLNGLPHSCYNQGLELAKAGDLPQARDRLMTAVSIAPDMVDGHVVLGKVYAQLGQYEQAISCWQRALELDSENAAALKGRR